MALYPPILPTSIPAFAANEQKVYVPFEWPKLMPKEELKIQYSITTQNTNESALKEGVGVQGLLTQNINNQLIIIDTNNIQEGWQAGRIYKVQARFTNNTQKMFSEWSTICYLKATAKPQVSILNEGDFITSDSPVFYGKYENVKDREEIEKKYKFDLYSLDTNNLIVSTDWKVHNQNEVDNAIFPVLLNNFAKYAVSYSIETKNGYKGSAEYSFTCSLDILDSPDFEISAIADRDNGRAKIMISAKESLSTNLILRRSDSRSNFTIWEDLKYFNILDEIPNIVFYDYLVEHGISYKYGIQVISQKGYRSELKFIQTPITIAYEDIFLVGDNKQLRIQYNPKISSWKRNLQEGKIDTIGSQYPFITRNGQVNYFTFPVSGLISYHMDEQETFCSKNSLGAVDQITTDFENNVNLDDANIVLEREFRNKVEEFLTNGNYKFFKSPTEGIKLIAVTGVQLTPQETLGRMIYSFSGTAYEVGAANLKNILNTDIQSLGAYTKVEDMGNKVIKDTMSLSVINGQNIYNEIQNKINSTINGKYKRKLEYLSGISIDIISSVNKDFQFTIYQDPAGNSSLKITINGNIGFYELNDVVKIYDLVVNTNGQINITYSAVCSYSEIEGAGEDYNADLISKSGYYQYVSTFFNESEDRDIFAMIKEKNGLDRLLNCSYLKVDAAPNFVFYLNGARWVIGETGTVEFKEIITSVLAESNGSASFSVIYNGVTEKA